MRGVFGVGGGGRWKGVLGDVQQPQRCPTQGFGTGKSLDGSDPRAYKANSIRDVTPQPREGGAGGDKAQTKGPEGNASECQGWRARKEWETWEGKV